MLKNAYMTFPIFLYSIISDSLKLSITHVKFISQLNKNFAINNFILLSNHSEETYSTKIFVMKYLSTQNMQTAFMSSVHLNSSLFALKQPPRIKQLVLLSHEDDLYRIFKIRNEFYHWTFVWVMFDAEESKLEKVYVPYNCKFLNVITLNKTIYELIEVYNPKVYQKIHYMIYGSWQDDAGFEISSLDFYTRRFNMNGSVLEVVAPYKEGMCPHPILCTYEEIMGEMRRTMNFETTHLTWMEYKEFIRNKTKNFSVEIDFGLFLFHSVNYMKNLVAPIWKTPAFLHIAYDKSYKQGYSDPHLLPFTKNLWIITGFWIIASGVVTVTVHYTAFKLKFHDRFLFVCYLFLPFESFANQCGSKPPKLTSSRIALFATRLAPWFIVPVYSAAVLSFVTVKLINVPFNDLKGLIDDGSFKIGYENGTFPWLFFDKANDELSKTALENFIVGLDEMPQNSSIGIKRMCKDHKFALLFFNNDIYRQRRKCKITQIPTPVLVAWDGFMLRPNSPYKLIFHRIIKTLFSAGILTKMGIRAYGKKPIEVQDDEPDPVDLTSILPLCHLIICIYCIAVFVFCFEHIYHN